MLFCLFSWKEIEGIEAVLTGCILCLTVFFVLSVLPRRNQSRKGLKRIGIAMLSCEVLCSLLWLLIFYPDGNYHNYGLQGGLFGLIYPASLAAAWMVVRLPAKKRRR